MNENTINEREKLILARVSRCKKKYNTIALLRRAIKYLDRAFLPPLQYHQLYTLVLVHE